MVLGNLFFNFVFTRLQGIIYITHLMKTISDFFRQSCFFFFTIIDICVHVRTQSLLYIFFFCEVTINLIVDVVTFHNLFFDFLSQSKINKKKGDPTFCRREKV